MRPNGEINIRVLGGLPVIAQVWIQPADPEVGIWSPYIDDYQLLHHKTRKPHGPWLYERIEKDGLDKVEAAIWKEIELMREESLSYQADLRADAYYDARW